MPLLDLDLARNINEAIVALLRRGGPDGRPFPEDHPGAEIARDLPRRESREILYLPDLAVEPAWPPVPPGAQENREQIFIRVATARERVTYAAAVFTGNLVHWRRVEARVPSGELTSVPLDPDSHWSLGLETAEKAFREKGLTAIPPAVLSLVWGRWTLADLLDPVGRNLSAAREEMNALATLLQSAKTARNPARAYDMVVNVLRLGYDLATLADAVKGREPSSYVELNGWLAERAPPFAWTRGLQE